LSLNTMSAPCSTYYPCPCTPRLPHSFPTRRSSDLEPRLMLLHFLCVDSLQHLHGPRSPEAYWAIDYVDGLIGRFLATLPADELADRKSTRLNSSHGFLPVAHEVRPTARLRQPGLLRAAPAGG